MSKNVPNAEFNESWQPMLSQILEIGRSSGADFIEIFLEKREKYSIGLESKEISAIAPIFTHGVGIRILKGRTSAYVSTQVMTHSGLNEILQKGLSLLGLDTHRGSTGQKSVELETLKDFSTLKNKLPWCQTSSAVESFCPILSGIQNEVFDKTPHLQALNTQYVWDLQNVMVAASDGTFSRDTRLYQYFKSLGIFEEGAHRTSVTVRQATCGDPHMVHHIHAQDISAEMSSCAGPMLKARYVQSGHFPIVMANGFGGVIFHEACGHLLETTQLVANSTPFRDCLGTQIAHPCLSAWDCAYPQDTYFGSVSMDDEGLPAQNTLLIENGILKNFLADRVGGAVCSLPRTGSGRRQDYRFAATSRMRNTFIAAGPHTPQQVLDSLEEGLYCKRMGGGSVGPTGDYNFSVEEAYWIKNGKISEPVKGATLIGKAETTLKQISMCANDVALSPGFCGSTSGTVYVSVGQPHIRVDNMTIGGR